MCSDYLTNAEVLLSQRTQFYWNHTGMWTTETHHLTGAYDQKDYGCSGRDGWRECFAAAARLPPPLCRTISALLLPAAVWLMQSGYLHLDWAGDSGTGEEAIMALDYYSYTLDPSYLHIAFAAGDFLMQVLVNALRKMCF